MATACFTRLVKALSSPIIRSILEEEKSSGKPPHLAESFPTKLKLEEMIGECELFVFTKPENPDSYINVHDEWKPGDDAFPCSPFPTIHVEFAGMDLCRVTVSDDMSMSYTNHSMIIHEAAPDVYKYIVMSTDFKGREMMHYFCDGDLIPADKNIAIIRKLVNYLMSRIHQESEGVEVLRKNIKFGKGRSAIKRVIRRVIHIAPKNKHSSASPVQDGRKIIFSHSWLVRGFWRKVKSVGKNRAGEYCVPGKTFVVPHKRGEGELIHKIRVVD